MTLPVLSSWIGKLSRLPLHRHAQWCKSPNSRQTARMHEMWHIFQSIVSFDSSLKALGSDSARLVNISCQGCFLDLSAGASEKVFFSAKIKLSCQNANKINLVCHRGGKFSVEFLLPRHFSEITGQWRTATMFHERVMWREKWDFHAKYS